jgi:sRNA-binding protein
MVVDTSEITTLQGNVNGKMDAGGARNKRKHITHRKKNIKNRKINIKHKKRVTRKNKIFKRVY